MKDVQKTGKRCLLDIDVQGVKQIKQQESETNYLETQQYSRQHSHHYYHHHQQQQQQLNNEKQDDNDEHVLWLLKPKYVFIAPPSFSVLQKRLRGRGTETEESVRIRTENAKKELEYGLADGNFDRIIINDDLDQSCREFFNAV